MAIGTPTERYAQSRTVQGATTTFSPTGTIAVGSKAIIACSTGVDGKLPSSVTDTQGNTWVVDVSYNAVADAKNIAFVSSEVTTQMTTGTTITINWAVSTNNQVHVYLIEVTGLASSSPFDKTANGTAGTGTSPVTSSSGTLSQADEIVLGCVRHDDMTGWAKDASYTAMATAVIGGLPGTALIWKIVSATTATTAGGTVTNSGDWAAALATYKAPAGTTVTVPGAAVGTGAAGVSPPEVDVSLTYTVR